MLTRFDEHLIHQTPEPVAHPASGDPNVYDRYFFNGYTPDGELFFGAALGLYPNRRVMDAAFSVVHHGRQLTVRASRLAPQERGDTAVGPITVAVEDPMRVLRLHIGENEFGLTGDLRFRARTPAIEEPRFTHRVDGRVFLDYTRYTQFGLWEGWLAVDGERIELGGRTVFGTRDRSWGIRPVGERGTGAPGPPPQFFWLWAPLHFDDVCTHFAVNEDATGRPWHASGCVAPVFQANPPPSLADDPPVEPMARVAHTIQWQSGTRRAASAELTLTPYDGAPHTIALEPILTFQMLGLGYLHPEWGHGMWKGEAVVSGESWTLADLDPLAPFHVHVQQLCRARMGEREGVGLLEQLVIGPHAPSGFSGLMDPAP